MTDFTEDDYAALEHVLDTLIQKPMMTVIEPIQQQVHQDLVALANQMEEAVRQLKGVSTAIRNETTTIDDIVAALDDLRRKAIVSLEGQTKEVVQELKRISDAIVAANENQTKAIADLRDALFENGRSVVKAIVEVDNKVRRTHERLEAQRRSEMTKVLGAYILGLVLLAAILAVQVVRTL